MRISALILALFGSVVLRAAPVTILPLGDSITEGRSKFASYRMPLWEMLVGQGYIVEFVGARASEERIGSLRHEGHSGETAEYLADHIGEFYRANPANIVLLQAGHNHTVDENPVAGIVAATRRIVATLREINPRVVILLAQPIPSGKLPKYGYLPALRDALAELARADQAAHAQDGVRPVVLVDQAAGFDWRVDTIADRVHPNAAGARKLAQRWFDALQPILPAPAHAIPIPARVVYKQFGDTELALNVFQPPARTARPAPAIVYFFGGGWHVGTPIQFYRECARLSAQGIVAISVDYRIDSTGPSTPFDSLADAKSAMRWVRAHAAELGIDPTRVAAAGASAGGHLAVATALVPGFDDPADDKAVSCLPDALVLLYPVLDTALSGYRFDSHGIKAREISPLAHVSAPVPPTMVLVGDQDKILPVATAKLFQSRVRAAGGRCELFVYPGAGHPIWPYRSGESEVSRDIDGKVDAFLHEIGWIEPVGR